MNSSLKALIHYLLDHEYIGGRHTPEERLLRYKTRWIDKEDKFNFEKEYKQLVNQGFIIREKKKTGKGTDWHIYLNPHKLKELYELLRM